MSFIDPFMQPGMGDPVESSESEFTWGPIDRLHRLGVVLVSTAVDTANTPTTTLRRGLVLGKITSTGKYKEYDPTATDGSQIPVGVLMHGRNMLDPRTATAGDRQASILLAGPLKVGSLIGFDENCRRIWGTRFVYDDLRWVLDRVQVKAADYTVLATDNGTTFTTRGASGAVNFTLPAIDRGLEFTFFNEADQNMTITAATADTMVVFNDLAADSIAFSTSSEKIGGGFRVKANDNETKWLVMPILGAETQTPTIAT